MFSDFDGGDLASTIMAALSLVLSSYAIWSAYELQRKSAMLSREHSFTDMFLNNFDVMSQGFNELSEAIRRAEQYASEMQRANGYGPNGLWGVESMVSSSMFGATSLLNEIKARAAANFRLVRLLGNARAPIHAKVKTLVSTLNTIDPTIENFRPPQALMEILYGQKEGPKDALFHQWRKALREIQARVQAAHSDACLATIEMAQAELK